MADQLQRLSVPEFGEHTTEEPMMVNALRPSYWSAVVDYAKEHPGQWIELLNCPISRQRLSTIANRMNTRTVAGESYIPKPLRNVPGFRVRYVKLKFWFRFDAHQEA